MAFKTVENFIKAAEPEQEEKNISKKKQKLIYLNENNIEFLEQLKFKHRSEKLSMSDFINEAIEQYLKKKYKGI